LERREAERRNQEVQMRTEREFLRTEEERRRREEMEERERERTRERTFLPKKANDMDIVRSLRQRISTQDQFIVNSQTSLTYNLDIERPAELNFDVRIRETLSTDNVNPAYRYDVNSLELILPHLQRNRDQLIVCDLDNLTTTVQNINTLGLFRERTTAGQNNKIVFYPGLKEIFALLIGQPNFYIVTERNSDEVMIMLTEQKVKTFWNTAEHIYSVENSEKSLFPLWFSENKQNEFERLNKVILIGSEDYDKFTEHLQLSIEIYFGGEKQVSLDIFTGPTVERPQS